ELARLVADAGQALEQGNLNADDLFYDRAKQQAGHYLNSAVSSGIEGWLSSYGRAEVTLGAGFEGNFSWGIDYIQPLYRGANSALLYALGSHRLDDRMLADAGLIYRFGLGDNTMLGTNLFVDQDLEHSHTRASVGLELMAPWWRLTSNYYAPLTDWRTTDQDMTLDFAFAAADTPLQERPARGYDLSLEGGLPLLPQLTAEATVTQWLGDHVDVAGGGQQTESEPVSGELTLNYQPLPLVRLSATRAILPGADDNSVRLQLTFNLDQSLEQQLQPVTGASLFGDTPDMATRFVNRNYRMVMAYRVDPRSQELNISDVDVVNIPRAGHAYSASSGDITMLEDWHGEPGARVRLTARVTDGLGRPVANVPVYWHLDAVNADGSPNDSGGYHGAIVGADGSPSNISGAVHDVTGFSNAEGKVFLMVTDSEEERLLVNARVNAAALTSHRLG
ncbi:MAG: inverse autotransporter beta domain-containing protein, partial [Kistimonas sp.]|nr:inverse autotransporter beta domain-containing protein [Kistimonas sp.]